MADSRHTPAQTGQAPYEGTDPYIFVSYSHKDNDRVLPVIRAMQARGYRVWYDAGIHAGTQWPEIIADHVEQCGVFMPFYTAAFNASDWCRHEIYHALHYQKTIIQVYLEDVRLNRGIEIQVHGLQHLRYADDRTAESFVDQLDQEPELAPCRGKAQENAARILRMRPPQLLTIAAGRWHTAGLRADGTVVAVGDNDKGQCTVTNWRDIVSVAAGEHYTVGLHADGTVAAVGDNRYGQCNISGWQNMVSIAAGNYHTVGLCADGTVVAVGDNRYGQCNVTGWRDIVSIAAGRWHTAGLRADGMVVVVGDNRYGQYSVTGWRDIVSIAAGRWHTADLRADGTVVAVGDNRYGQCNVTGWQDIVSIAAGWLHTVGLRADGTVVAVGDNSEGQCNVSGWTGIRVPQRG